MEPTRDLWTAIRRVLPDADVLAPVVAAELGESIEDVRSSVLIGTIALNGQLGPERAAVAAIEGELRRAESMRNTTRSRTFAAKSLEELLAQTRELDAKGALDLEMIVAVQRASGAIAARQERRLAILLHRYAVTRRLLWEACVDAVQTGRLDPVLLASFGRFLLLWNELTSLAVTEGYRTAERDILARAVQARRGALHQLLGLAVDDAAGVAQLRRIAVRQGLNPNGTYRLIAIAVGVRSEEDLEELAGRIGHLLGTTAPGAEGVGAGIRLPAVLPVMGRIAVLARHEWAGLARIPRVLGSVAGANWVAVGSRTVDGVDSLADAYADVVDATRTAYRLGMRGWIPDSDQLALERMLLADKPLADAAVRRELGKVLADERFGTELLETLQAYFDAGENLAATARNLHLATRTVAYRLDKIETLLGHRMSGEHGRRVSAALLVHRFQSEV